MMHCGNMPQEIAVLAGCNVYLIYSERGGNSLRQRVISSFVGLAILAGVLLFFDTEVLNVAVSIVAAMGVYEMVSAVGYNRHRSVLLLCMGVAVVLPFITTSVVSAILPVIIYLFFLMMFGNILRNYPKLDITLVGFSTLATLGVSLSMSCFVWIRDYTSSPTIAIYYTLIAMGSAWWADAGAYFAGRFFGKKKLAPNISPKKTVEGMIGGLCTAVLGNLFITALVTFLSGRGWFLGYEAVSLDINYIYVAIISPFLTLAGVMGDLSASVIKRHFHIKDFGSIMPGHGGVMDRFDSLLFIVPSIYLIMLYLPIA